MKLSDVMSAMGLAAYAEVSLVIFFAVFVAVVFHVYRRDLRAHWEQASRMPLDDDNPQHPRDLEENG
ncbi:MAG: CcoQ/FixQ family Cbb3-type cytochrome c oxidase assembly chaperone [Polyangiaceae bacterium]|nr:CcoQ/FixQ family Cbb3-type cytochrome c oxidase assembly chaperone [Polyangiaceae bacterium]